MKRIVGIAVLFVITSAFAFAQMKDGTFSAKEDKADARGYVAQIKITVKGGEIAKVEYDESKAGKSKWKDASYNANMKKIAGVAWMDAVTSLEKSLQQKKKAEDVDAVSGATELSERFKKLAEKAFAQ